MKIGRLTFYDEDLLKELRNRDLNLSVMNDLLRDFLGKNINSDQDLSKKKQIIEELEEKKKEIESEFKFFRFIKNKKIDQYAVKWIKSYVLQSESPISREKIEADVESYVKNRVAAHLPFKFKQKHLEVAIKRWAGLTKV